MFLLFIYKLHMEEDIQNYKLIWTTEISSLEKDRVFGLYTWNLD